MEGDCYTLLQKPNQLATKLDFPSQKDEVNSILKGYFSISIPWTHCDHVSHNSIRCWNMATVLYDASVPDWIPQEWVYTPGGLESRAY